MVLRLGQDSRSFTRGYGQSMATIIASEEEFHVHRDLLCANSPYFNAAFNKQSSFSEASSAKIHLHEVQPRAVTLFLDWLYFSTIDDFEKRPKGRTCLYCNGKCSVVRKNERLSSVDSSSSDDKSLDIYLNTTDYVEEIFLLYQFADQFDVPQLRKDLVDALWSEHDSTSPPWFISIIFIYGRVPSEAPILNLLVDRFVDEWDGSGDRCPIELKLVKSLPQEFMYRVMLGKEKLRQNPDNKALKRWCAYHEHEQTADAIKSCKREAKKSRKPAWDEDKQQSLSDDEAEPEVISLLDDDE